MFIVVYFSLFLSSVAIGWYKRLSRTPANSHFSATPYKARAKRGWKLLTVGSRENALLEHRLGPNESESHRRLSKNFWAGSNSMRAHESRWAVSGQTRARVWTLNNSHPSFGLWASDSDRLKITQAHNHATLYKGLVFRLTALKLP